MKIKRLAAARLMTNLKQGLRVTRDDFLDVFGSDDIDTTMIDDIGALAHSLLSLAIKVEELERRLDEQTHSDS